MIALAAFSVAGLLAAPWIESTLEDQLLIEPDVETDRALMKQTEERLRQEVLVLQSLPTPINAKARDARRHGCATDSGDVFQPGALRVWEVTPSASDTVAAALADALREKGWAVPSSPSEFGQYSISVDRGEWSAAGAVITSFNKDQVSVHVGVRDAEPCRLESD